jgi:hypothetical protein
MATPEGAQLAQKIRMNVEEFKKTCEGIDEATANRAPADRWSPKQIVSHLCGPEGSGFMPTLRAILDQDIPSMTMAELLAEFEREYGRMADLVEGLTQEQLDRKAHIPLLKESPFGEYPTLAGWVGVLTDYHINFHVNHMNEIVEELE